MSGEIVMDADTGDIMQNVKIVKSTDKGPQQKSSSQSKVQRNKVMSDISQITSKKKRLRPSAMHSIAGGGTSTSAL